MSTQDTAVFVALQSVGVPADEAIRIAGVLHDRSGKASDWRLLKAGLAQLRWMATLAAVLAFIICAKLYFPDLI